MRKFGFTIVLSVLACVLSAVSFLVNWPFQMSVTGILYLVSAFLIARNLERVRDKRIGILLLIIPFILVYAIGSIVNKSYITYPIWIIAIINAFLGYSIAFIKVGVRRITTLTLLCILMIPFCFYGMLNWIHYQRSPNAVRNIPMKSFQFQDLEGKNLNLSDFKGKTIFVEFWATNCGPCIKRFPDLQKMHDEYVKDTSVLIASVNLPLAQDKRLTLSQFGNLHTYTFRKYFCKNESIWEELEVEYMPLVFVIDKDFNMRYRGTYRGESYYLYGNPIRTFKNLVNDN